MDRSESFNIAQARYDAQEAPYGDEPSALPCIDCTALGAWETSCDECEEPICDACDRARRIDRDEDECLCLECST